jgi:MHS family proline/betaine transporter-like MFS transporter
MDESPEFERLVAAGTVPTSPVRQTLRFRRGALARTFAISAMGSITYYVGITYVPAFLHRVGRQTEGESLWLSTLAAVVVILVTPLAGMWSDRIGRKPVLAGAAILGIVLPLAMFALMARGNTWQVAAAAMVLAGIAGAYSAVGAPATAEQFPAEGRLSGLALGVTAATVLFGGLTPLLAEVIIRQTGWAASPGAMIALVGAAVLPVLLAMPETRPHASGVSSRGRS